MASEQIQPIGQRSKTCQGLFKSCRKAIAGCQGPNTTAIVREFKRGSDGFNAWASQLGPLEDVQTSLHFQVRKLPDIAELFHRHLTIIESRIQQAHICAGYTADSSPGDWELPELLESIQESVDMLNKLSKLAKNEQVIGRIAHKNKAQVTNYTRSLAFRPQTAMHSLAVQEAKSTSALWCVPLARNEQFVGRQDTLDKLRSKFFEDQCRKLVLVGLGGTGKTQVALSFAYWVRANHPEYSVFWLSALTNSSFERTYTDIASHLPIDLSPGEDFKDLAKQYLSSPRIGPWLLIVDNADDNDLLFDDEAGLAKYLPTNEMGLTLFTTRVGDIARQAAGLANRIIRLDVMKETEALHLLENSASIHVRSEGGLTAELLGELNYLPLAIAQTAAYMDRNQISVKKYLEMFRGAEKDKIDMMSIEYGDDTRYRERGSTNAVATALLASFDQIHKLDLDAAYIISAISHIEPNAIPASILPEVQSKSSRLQALGTLLGSCLIKKREDEDVYDMHSLVHFMASIWVRSRGLEEIFNVQYALTKHLDRVLPFPGHENRAIWNAHLPHALRLLHKQERPREIMVPASFSLSSKIGQFLYQDERYREALQCFKISFALAQNSLAEDHPDRLASKRNLAMAREKSDLITKASNPFEHAPAKILL